MADDTDGGAGTDLVQVINRSGLPATLRQRAKKHVLALISAFGGHEFVRKVVEAKGTIEGQAIVDRHLAEAAGRALAADPAQVERAIGRFAGQAIRQQQNVEAVAVEALKLIEADPPPEDPSQSEEVDEDWMNIFTRHAENASSDQMRGLWAKVLAGHIRKEGSFSPRAMRVVSELDQQTARDFQEIAPRVINDVIFRPPDWKRGAKLEVTLRLASAGLIQSGDLARQIKLPNGAAIVAGNAMGLAIHGAPGQSVTFPAIVLTNIGKELLPLMPPPDESANLRELAKELEKQGLRSIYLGRVVDLDANLIGVQRDELLWGEPVGTEINLSGLGL